MVPSSCFYSSEMSLYLASVTQFIIQAEEIGLSNNNVLSAQMSQNEMAPSYSGADLDAAPTRQELSNWSRPTIIFT